MQLSQLTSTVLNNCVQIGFDIFTKGEYFQDRHGVGNEFPPLDPKQNIEVLDGIQSDGWTMVKFRRQLASCEPYDLPITVS